MGTLNIISVISVNQHLASVLPFPYFGQTLPELLRNCLRAQLEWYAARDAFEKAVQDGESHAEIDQALSGNL